MRWAVLGMALCGAAPATACTVAPERQAMPGSLSAEPGGAAPAITRAWYQNPTDIYGHGIMGPVQDASLLVAKSGTSADSCGILQVQAGPDHVFEDTAPRLVDVTGDGRAEIIAVRSHVRQGAQLAIYADAEDGFGLRLLAATPYIGTRYRWLAPVGAADLDGDGTVEIAYIDRPHLAKVLRVWRYGDGALTEIAAGSGLTNHRIGEEVIRGGLRDCGQGPEMIMASADWSRVMAVTFDGTQLSARVVNAPADRAGFATALVC